MRIVGGAALIIFHYVSINQHHYGQHIRPARYGKGMQVLERHADSFRSKRSLGTPYTSAAGMAAALPGVIAANTPLPVIGVPIKGMLDGLDAMLSIIQMPPGIPTATVGVNGAMNAAILACEMISLCDEEVAKKMEDYKAGLGAKIEKANQDLAEIKYDFKTN